MAYSRYGLTDALYRGTNISFVTHVNYIFMKYSISLSILVALRTFTEGVNAECTVMPKSLKYSHFCIDFG